MKTEFESMMPLSIDDIIQGIDIPLDVYIKLSDEKYVLVAKSGTKPILSQFKNYQNKEVRYVWVHTKDFYKLAHQSVQIAGMAVDRKDVNDQIKTSFVTQAARSIFSQMDHLGLNLEVFNNARQVTETVVTLAENHKSFTMVLDSLRNCSDALLAHSVAVSTVSTIIGTELGFEKRITLEKLALGGLLHDIGIKALPKELITKPIATMTSEEIYQWETHSFKGAQLLQNLGVVGEDVIAIVLEHHENAVGQGFPSRMRDIKMHPLAKIVSLANAFCDMILPNVNSRSNKNPREAVLYIELTLGTPYNKEAFRALKRIVDGPSEKKKRTG
jgi:putative nucleotidyltransferase with HDIG domain